MDEDTHLEVLADLLKDAEQSIKDEADKVVEVEHCINIKKLCDYKVSCSYGDIVLIICILKDYLKLIQKKKALCRIIIEKNLQSWQIIYHLKQNTTTINR